MSIYIHFFNENLKSLEVISHDNPDFDRYHLVVLKKNCANTRDLIQGYDLHWRVMNI